MGANKPIKLFSKLFNKSINHDGPFAAIMTCSDADENCPYIPGAEIVYHLNTMTLKNSIIQNLN